VFHEDTSVPASEKAARAYLDRLLPWIEAHRDVPFFVLIHVTDPHWPYPGYAPYDTFSAKPEDRDPLDLENIANENPEVVERLSQRLEDWRQWPSRRGSPRMTKLRPA